MSTFINPILGGLLIGLSAALLLFLLGRVAGISSVAWRAVTCRQSYRIDQQAWRVLFIFGLVAGTWAVHQFTNIAIPAAPSGNSVMAVVAGLLVGFGTKLGSGCTSGHGICGLANFSKRSLVATCTFMAAGFVTVYIMRHVLA